MLQCGTVIQVKVAFSSLSMRHVGAEEVGHERRGSL